MRMRRISQNRSDAAQDLRIFAEVCTYDIENRGKGGRDEAGSRICPVLCGGGDDIGVDPSEHIRRGAVYHIVYIGGI